MKQEAQVRTVLLRLKERFDKFLFWLAEAIASIRVTTPTSWW
jgi:hypothetical protein